MASAMLERGNAVEHMNRKTTLQKKLDFAAKGSARHAEGQVPCQFWNPLELLPVLPTYMAAICSNSSRASYLGHMRHLPVNPAEYDDDRLLPWRESKHGSPYVYRRLAQCVLNMMCLLTLRAFATYFLTSLLSLILHC